MQESRRIRHGSERLSEPASRRWLTAVLGASALILGLAGCKEDQERAAESVTTVRVTTASEVETVSAITLSGTVVPRIESRLAFRVPGRIAERGVEVGDAVAKGAPLARLDAAPYRLAVEEAQARRTEARAALDQARRDVERNRSLTRSGAVANARFEAIETAAQTAEARVEQAETRLQMATNDLAYATLQAPADGIVTRVSGEVGQYVGAGQLVVDLAHRGALEVQVDVPESWITMIRPGDTAEVSLLAHGTSELAGRVREIAPMADPATRTYRVRVTLDDVAPGVAPGETHGADAMRLGMTASVRFAVPAPRAIRLPMTALFQDGEQPAVWVVDPGSWRLELRRITLAELGTGSLSVAAGLEPGEQVVSAGVHRLDAGQTVRIWDGRLP